MFSFNPLNVGGFKNSFNNIDGIAFDIANRSFYYVRREEGKYIFFEPISIGEYFSVKNVKGFLLGKENQLTSERFTPHLSDIEFFRSFKHMELRNYGTLEMRGDCCQPVASSFAPAAFYAGVLENKEKVSKLLELFDGTDSVTLRREVIYDGRLSRVPNKDFSTFLVKLLGLVVEGLKKRNFLEEEFIYPLYKRAETLMSPADKNIELMQKGYEIDSIIKINASRESCIV